MQQITDSYIAIESESYLHQQHGDNIRYSIVHSCVDQCIVHVFQISGVTE